MRPFGVVVLAAGGSSRLGTPKQLLPYRGGTLVEHMAQEALDSGASEVVVVVGACADAVGERLARSGVRIALNPMWQEGIGSSIRTGVAALDESCEAAVIALCDQPKVTAAHLRALAERIFAGNAMVASSYDDAIGVPAAFDRSEFHTLKSLRGDSGARDLIRRAGLHVATVPFGEPFTDIDTSEDVERIKSEDH